MKRQTLAGTLMLLVIVLLAAASGLDAPVVSAGSFVSRQEIRQQHQQSNDPALSSLTVTVNGTAQPLSPAFSSTVKYYTVVVAAVTQITVAGAAPVGDSVAYQETNGTAIDDADTNTTGHQVDIPTAGKRVNIVVTRTASGTTTTYGLLLISEGPAAADTVALMALYNSAGGENWTTSANWATAEPISSWSGVTTDSNGRVTELSLYNNRLSGTISDLSDLTSLRLLDLGTNALTEEIPDLNSLTSLEQLYLWGNQLSGPIPDLSALTSLQYLSLSQNQLTGSIPDLSSLGNLKQLYLWSNQLSGPIPDLSGLTSLQYLSLSQNKLTGPIPDLSSLGNVIQLYLWDNKLSGPIPDLSALTSLQELSLAQNQLTGVIPESLNRLVSSTFLNLSFNELEGEIPELVSLTNLVTLALGGNQLTGEIPPSLNTLTTLKNLYLWRNKLTGEIPDLSSLTLMLELDLHKNELTGPVPTWLNDFAAIQGLWLNDNKLMGTIPDLSNLQALYTVELSNNDLSGSIPPSLGTLKELQNLILNDNRLTGQIPDLSGLESLAQLDMAGNQLTGPIPASLGQITGLQELYLQGNLLTGEIPAVLAELASLKAARFANDALTGCVPHGLRFLLDADEVVEGKPVHDFIAVDANNDGDTDDEDDVPQLHLPFCMLLTLWFSDASFAFAPGTTAYTTEIRVASTMVTLAQNEPTDQVSIMKGGSSYGIDEAVPLDIGPNLFTIEVTPSDARLLPQTYTVEVLHDGKVESDRDALIALYNSTVGSGWTNNTHWDSALSLDMWHGVYTNNDGRVVEINLTENNLSGTLPAQLAMLTKLAGLILTDNQLTGAIPIELSQLSELATLDLSENMLRGAIPPELANLTPMVYLDLSANQFSGTIPAELGTLIELKTLDLGDNQLSGTIPPELGLVSSMYALRLNDNQLSGTIPPELGGLIHLDFLSLQNNELSGKIPEALVDIGSTPASDGSVGLRFARFANDRLTGCVPYGLRYLLNKSDLDVGIGVDVPAHDFTRDYDGDGDYDDQYDTEGLSLPFCGLSDLTLSGLTLEPAFSASVEAYTASAAHSVTSTTVSASLNPPISGLRTDELTITKGGDLYQSGASMPLDIGPNLITIVVTSDDGTITPHTYRVTVTRPPNTPPAFDEGAAATRDVDENTGAGQPIGDPLSATDADIADTLTYSLDAASDEFFDIDSSGQLWTKAELDHETKSSYRLTVSVSDGVDELGNSDNDAVDDTVNVTINVIDINEAPQITGDASPSFAENSSAPISTYTATDPDGDTLTYSLSGPDDGAFSIDAGSGQLRAGQPLDFETKNRYLVTVEVHDGADESGTPSTDVDDRLDVTINVIDINEAPQITGDAAPSFAENSSAPIATYTATDPDGDTLTYSLNGPDHGAFSIDAGSGQLRARQPLDFETRNNYRVTVEVHDGADDSGNPSTLVDDRLDVTINVIDVNEPPEVSGEAAPSFAEHAQAPIATYTATDPEGGTLTWTTDPSTEFWISSRGALHFATPPTYDGNPIQVTIIASHEDGESGSLIVRVTVTDEEDEGTVTIGPPRGWDGTRFDAELTDRDGVVGGVAWQWARSTNRSTWTDITTATLASYRALPDDIGNYLRATASYRDRQGSDSKTASVALTGRIEDVNTKPATNEPPVFAEPSTTRSIGQGPYAGRSIGAPVRTTDPDTGDVLTYSLSGTDADLFDIDPATGQLRTKAVLDLATGDTYAVTVDVHDGYDASYGFTSHFPDASIQVTITVTAVRTPITSGGSGSSSGGGGGGGPPPVPVPSDADLDWNVTLDIESLDREHDLPTGVWSDGQTVWIVDNAAAGADSLFAYELQSGERQADRELELDRRNRFSHGIWSDGELVWIADSGQDRLFVYHLESGERNEERELELTERNSDPRGIWSDGEVIYVLDSVKDALFVYNLEAGDLLAEHALDKLNRSPRGIWSDGAAIWVSDDGAKRLFAYEVGDTALTRNEDLEFTFRSLLKAGNGDPRGIWSDGDVVWVVDEQDDKVYSYNIPDVIVARLSSLTLSELEIGAFSPARLDYAASAESGQTATSVAAEATTEVATIVVQPSDTDSDPENGHQVNLQTDTPITITVTSGDGSRTTTYRVLVSRPSCLEGLSTEPLSAVSFVGGSVGELETCARSHNLSAFYHQLDGVWTAFFLDAPEFLSRPFRDRFAEGLSPGETLIAKRQPVAAVAQSIPGAP